MNILRKTGLFLSALLFIAAMAISSCNTGSDKKNNDATVDLKLNFKQGDKYLYATEVKQKINSSGMNMDQSMLMEMIYELKGTEGENKKLDITYDRIVMKMGGSEYDSKKPGNENSEMGFIHHLIGKSFSLILAPDGNITQVEGLGELIKSVSGTNKETRAEVEAQFSDTAIKLMMQNSFDLYPGKAVKTGETWVKKSQMGFSGINVDVENTYTLESVVSGKAHIKVRSVMNLPLTNMGNATSGAMQLEMKGDQEGTMDVDVATGQIISGTTKQNITGKIKISGQEMPMSIVGDIVINSKKI